MKAKELEYKREKKVFNVMSKYGPNSKVLGKISIKIEPLAEAEAVHTEVKPHFWS